MGSTRWLNRLEKGRNRERRSAISSPGSPSARAMAAAARAFKDASEICPALRLRGGYVEGKVVDAARVEKLAQIPSRETLLAQLAGMLKAPLRRLAYGLLSRPRAFVRGLNILRERMEEENSSKQEV